MCKDKGIQTETDHWVFLMLFVVVEDFKIQISEVRVARHTDVRKIMYLRSAK